MEDSNEVNLIQKYKELYPGYKFQAKKLPTDGVPSPYTIQKILLFFMLFQIIDPEYTIINSIENLIKDCKNFQS